MLYAKVVLGLPVEGPFDYTVPPVFMKKIKAGMRVWVPFRTQKMLGYVVELAGKTSIRNLKAVSDLVDASPILDKNMLLLAKELSDYYCCSWGEAIATALPEALRKGRALPKTDIAYNNKAAIKKGGDNCNKKALLLHDPDGVKRWDIYLNEIRKVVKDNRSVIILLPDMDSVIKTEEIIRREVQCSLAVLYRKHSDDLKEWLKITGKEVNIAVGTRASIFAPFKNLGLIIIDEEESSIYKQEQTPHYNARVVAFMRARREKAGLILGSTSPSLESLYLARKSHVQYIFIPQARAFPEVKVLDMRNLGYSVKKNTILCGYLQDSISSTLNLGGKVLLFLNRKGFATFASCLACRAVLKCPRCSINLVYHFSNNILSCHYCNFKMPPPKICPACNSGYIKYAGLGTEKVESELARIFPSTKIKRWDNIKGQASEDADIFVATQYIIREQKYSFGLIGVLSIDNSLNRIDFRSSEKTFALLMGLLRLAESRILIQTSLPEHHAFRALVNKDINIFYDEELKQRRQLAFPPYRSIALVKLRGKQESKVKEISNSLFQRLKENNKNKSIKIASLNPGHPFKLRGNFCWQIMIRANSAKLMSKFLKIYLRNFAHSGIIVTVDIDPV